MLFDAVSKGFRSLADVLFVTQLARDAVNDVAVSARNSVGDNKGILRGRVTEGGRENGEGTNIAGLAREEAGIP